MRWTPPLLGDVRVAIDWLSSADDSEGARFRLSSQVDHGDGWHLLRQMPGVIPSHSVYVHGVPPLFLSQPKPLVQSSGKKNPL